MLADKLSENNINLIFAVTDTVVPLYLVSAQTWPPTHPYTLYSSVFPSLLPV